MKTDLKYILARNNSNLKKFIAYNKIQTYSDLLVVCEERNFIPISEEEFTANAVTKAETPASKSEKGKESEERVQKRKSSRRRSSSSQRSKSSGTSSKKVKDS